MLIFSVQMAVFISSIFIFHIFSDKFITFVYFNATIFVIIHLFMDCLKSFQAESIIFCETWRTQ